MFETLGWIACLFSIIGTVLATSYSRKWIMWGWVCFLVGNVFWVFYGFSSAVLPLIVYNSLRIVFSVRGIKNNTLKHIKSTKLAKRKTALLHRTIR